jgi:KipI family sensor histidine kinase inhibitor
MDVRILPSGTTGLLVEVGDLDEVLRLFAALRAARLPGVVDLVPAGRTILVVADGTVDLGALSQRIRGVGPVEQQRVSGELVRVPVRYRGDDLPEVAEALGCSVEALVERHVAEEWVVAFAGFAPGFAYLVGTRYEWNVPRRASPRTRVPAGAVALAGEFSGVYPRESPGGWQLIGWAEVQVFDPDREPPALLVPGARVRFEEVT